MACVCLTRAVANDNTVPGAATVTPFNTAVIKAIATYPTDGTHDYWWPRAGESSYDGVTRDLYLRGERVMEGEEGQRTFCCGLTLEVFLQAYNEWLQMNPEVTDPPVGPEDWQEFQRLWFVEELNGPGPSVALERFGIGHEIPMAEARTGDFVQIWRTANSAGRNTGHSVVFIEWVRHEEEDIVGMRYWSTQPSTDGIGEQVEYFGPLGGMSTENTYFGRVDLDGWLASHRDRAAAEPSAN